MTWRAGEGRAVRIYGVGLTADLRLAGMGESGRGDAVPGRGWRGWGRIFFGVSGFRLRGGFGWSVGGVEV